MRWVIVSVVLLAALATGQWSESVVLDDSCYVWAGGPALVAAGADTVWAAWKSHLPDYYNLILARRFAGDSWEPVERVTIDSALYNYPAGILADSARVILAYYDGSYPVSGVSSQDSWGIYVVTRADSGWTEPQLVYKVTYEFPVDIRLGHDRLGGVGMTWEATGPPIPWPSSVLFSRKAAQGWTAAKYLAVATETLNYGQASLIPGDTADFYVVFSCAGAEPPYPCSAQVWTLGDTLLDRSATFAGGSRMLARSDARRYLVFIGSDKLYSSVNNGSGWEAPVEIPGPYGIPNLAMDVFGWVWVSWTDTAHTVVLVSHNAGNFWTSPETVAVCQNGSNPVMVSDDNGRMHCCWLDDNVGGIANVRWSYRLTRPGVEESSKPQAASYKLVPTLLSGASGIERLASSVVFDAMGRRVQKVRSGVYFVRDAGQTHKIVIQR
ncbi:hypothetical protein JXD38_00280 [candidate division WOR-3 bacterium]|nr:hypothetical protein [candidate division WOR-3 bacterium]